MKVAPGPDSPATGETEISVDFKGVRLSLTSSGQRTRIHISESSHDGAQPAASSSGSAGPTCSTAAPAAVSSSEEPPYTVDVEDETNAAVVQISDDDEFEMISDATLSKDIPFYTNPTSIELPVALRAQACRLKPCMNNVRPDAPFLCSGLVRMELAYESGRQAARFLRGDDDRIASANFSTAQSPRVYIVLRGGAAGVQYPCKVTSFSDFKIHVFEDHHRSRPTKFRENSVSRGFQSESEARAYCYGAGLHKLP